MIQIGLSIAWYVVCALKADRRLQYKPYLHVLRGHKLAVDKGRVCRQVSHQVSAITRYIPYTQCLTVTFRVIEIVSRFVKLWAAVTRELRSSMHKLIVTKPAGTAVRGGAYRHKFSSRASRGVQNPPKYPPVDRCTPSLWTAPATNHTLKFPAYCPLNIFFTLTLLNWLWWIVHHSWQWLPVSQTCVLLLIRSNL